MTDKQSEIAKKIDDLGYQFSHAILAGYMKGFLRRNLKEAVRAGPALGQAALVVEDENA